MFPREYRRALQEMAEEEAKKVAENEMINGGVDGDEEDDEEEVINEAGGPEKLKDYSVLGYYWGERLEKLKD